MEDLDSPGGFSSMTGHVLCVPKCQEPQEGRKIPLLGGTCRDEHLSVSDEIKLSGSPTDHHGMCYYGDKK